MTVGASARDPDWVARTTGASAYVDDLRLPAMLTARILRSPHPHALIRSIDTTPALRVPGVVAVLTGADLPRQYRHEIGDRHPLARGVVRFVGEEVAAVAAETPAAAEEALRAIAVRYRRLPAVSTVDQALAKGAPWLHERAAGGNVSLRVRREFGELAAARAATAASTSGSYLFGRQAHACMETNGTLASWDAQRARLDVWTSTQSSYLVRKELAEVLDLAPDQVVIHEVAVGGGFGAKSKITDHEAIAAALSMRCGRPVRLVLTRDEEFATTKSRHAFAVELTTGVDAAGRLTHRTARVTVDNGAYNHSGPSVTHASVGMLASLYRTAAVEVDAVLVDTNKNPGGQFRGYGGPQVIFAIESQLDELADQLGLDPIELRLRNVNQAGDVTHAGWRLTTARLAECLRAVREAIDWDRKRALAGSGRGVGVAVAMHLSGARTYPDANRSEAGIDLFPDGRIRVRFGGCDPGTGLRTVLAQVVAQELGVDLKVIEVSTMDTEANPFDLGAWSSRGTTMAGLAAQATAQAAAARLRALAAEKLHVDAADIRLAGGHAVAADHRRVALGDLVGAGDGADGALTVVESATVDTQRVDPVTGVANISPSYSFAAHAVEVEVDRDTGRVRVLRVVAAHDSGTIVNPRAATGQVVGGVVMGLGAALGEQLLTADGRMINPSYLNYPLPRAADVPDVEAILLEHPDPGGPYGAKAIGEITVEPIAAAVANAVAHATGVRIRALPITPDKVLTGLRAGAATRRYPVWRRPRRWWISAVRAAYPRGLHALLHRYGTRLARTPPAEPVESVDRPASVADAVTLLSAHRRTAPLGGGTDLLPARQQGVARATRLVDLTGVPELRTVTEDAGDLLVGGAVTLAELARDAHTSGDTALRTAIGTIASAQVRELATVAGNLCQQNRCWFYRNGFTCYKRGGATCPCYAVLGDHRFYHAVLDAHRCQSVTPSDLATVLTALDAGLAVTGPAGERELPIGRLYRGPGETDLRPGEVISRIRLPAAARARTTSFHKLGLWHGDFAVAAACASLAIADGVVTQARVVLGAVAPTPYRAGAVERRLVGQVPSPALLAEAADAWVSQAHPLAGNGWKVDLASGLLRRALAEAAGLAEPAGLDDPKAVG